jgi:hypothetical protein
MSEAKDDTTEPATSTVNDDDQGQPVRSARPSRKVRAAILFNGAALLSTTALLVNLEPKAPPFKGD